jgi:F-type H+-transporting ATPase subunit delta
MGASFQPDHTAPAAGFPSDNDFDCDDQLPPRPRVPRSVLVSDRTVARRYAAALFDVARKAAHTDRAGDELVSLVRTIEGHDELRRILETPAVPAQVKKEIISSLLEASGGFSDEVSRLAVMLAERDRLGLLNQLQAVYAERLLEDKKIVPAEVVTASPLSDENRAALTRALGSATGSEVRLTERVDPAIVGGVIARVGSLVFDGSVTRQLERLRQKLATNN